MVLVVALGMTLASVSYERVGPTRTVEGEGFCPGAEPCEIPALGGGMPWAYLIDDPQVSVPNQLAFGEDDFRWGPFALDVLFWLALCWGAVTFTPWQGKRGERAESGPGTNTSTT